MYANIERSTKSIKACFKADPRSIATDETKATVDKGSAALGTLDPRASGFLPRDDPFPDEKSGLDGGQR